MDAWEPVVVMATTAPLASEPFEGRAWCITNTGITGGMPHIEIASNAQGGIVIEKLALYTNATPPVVNLGVFGSPVVHDTVGFTLCSKLEMGGQPTLSTVVRNNIADTPGPYMSLDMNPNRSNPSLAAIRFFVPKGAFFVVKGNVGSADVELSLQWREIDESAP